MSVFALSQAVEGRCEVTAMWGLVVGRVSVVAGGILSKCMYPVYTYHGHIQTTLVVDRMRLKRKTRGRWWKWR